MFNVTCDKGPKYLLGRNVSTRAGAEHWVGYYREQYEGKPYPNGKGFYPFTNFRVVER